MKLNGVVVRAAVPVLLGCAMAGAAAAQSYKVAQSSIPAPNELAAPIRDALAPTALQVTGGSGPFCEIWLAKSVAPAASPQSEPDIAFGQIPEGALMGAIRFDGAASDYRGQSIKPGVYTLRYMLQPVDGNHEGVSPYRDYLLAVPAALDTAAAPIPDKRLLDDSRKASGSGHPSVWSLVPPDDPPASLPMMIHSSDNGDAWVVFFGAPLGKSTPMGLIVVGRSPES